MTPEPSITDLTLINAAGQTVSYAEVSRDRDSSYRGPTVKHTWRLGEQTLERSNPADDRLDLLPGAEGFLLCEKAARPDNLLLLDVHGRERMRLSVPWEITRRPFRHSAAYPSRFIGLTTPRDNPRSGRAGRLAVRAWVEYVGEYVFELDWKTGRFLWGRQLDAT